MLKINTFFVEMSGTILNSRIAELLGSDASELACSKRHALNDKEIQVYPLDLEKMKKLEESRVSEGFKFVAYREIRDSGKIIEIEHLGKYLSATSQASENAVIRRTESQLRKVLKRRKKKLRTTV